jgi:hypothetical protein
MGTIRSERGSEMDDVLRAESLAISPGLPLTDLATLLVDHTYWNPP